MVARLGSVSAQFHPPRVNPRCVAKDSCLVVSAQHAGPATVSCRTSSFVRGSEPAETFSCASWCSLTTSRIRLPPEVFGPSLVRWRCCVLQRSWISPLGRRAIRCACKQCVNEHLRRFLVARRRPQPFSRRGCIHAQWRSPPAAYACFDVRDVCGT